MRFAGRRCLLCNCEGSTTLEVEALARALGASDAERPFEHLCRAELERFRALAGSGEPLLVACTQEAPLFSETAGEAAERIVFANIRERAGWSVEGRSAGPKIAALLAEAAVAVPPAPALELRSEGRILVYGAGEPALAAAERLAGRLAPTVLLSEVADAAPPSVVRFPILKGRILRLQGHLGAFVATVENAAVVAPSSRDRLRFGPASPKTELEADLVLDLSGGAPLLTAAEKRDGYRRVDPRDALAIERALFDLVALVGTFEKPRYVTFRAELCAHSRSRRVGCTRCLDHCPTGAITPAGDHVAIDPYVCAGCGSCAGLCPTGAATYAAPPPTSLLERLRTLLRTYHRAGGRDAQLLVYEFRHGEELVSAIARFGRGLPARVLPFAVTELGQLGLELLAAPFALGASRTVLLLPPRKEPELASLRASLAQLGALLEGLGYGADRLAVLATDDPDELEEALWRPTLVAQLPSRDLLAMGGKRSLLRLVLERLHEQAPAPVAVVPLPAGAPLGRILVDVEGCTLCHACVGACPTGALAADPDRPMLRFKEEACVQCGLCENTCPEKVIRLEPRASFEPAVREFVTLKEEEPARCVRCGKVFGTKSSIERIVQKLAGTHWMFQTPEQIERIRMCEDCRVIVEFERGERPFAYGEPRRPRTTEDYLREREEARARQAEGEGSEAS
ncbi:MAG: 4Fe-4S binding protein [Geminicoccaceae bacterium]|nr:4Fe-4S binding protein [Geminicoccaceae bacterium]MDW8125356.1 4Fe-4S binding protein [Geminicoccaceae bacterium]MDW8341868.1 4Fe-4S binding protein [Geminicoccaceae bacterium]